jgi:anti-sigma B factor antagonist
MKISEKRISDVVVLNLEGSLMGGPEAVSLNEAVNHHLDEKSLKLVLNLESVERVNSSGLGILIKALTTFKTNGGVLKLANVNPKVKNLLVITKLDTILDSYDSVEAAVKSF